MDNQVDDFLRASTQARTKVTQRLDNQFALYEREQQEVKKTLLDFPSNLDQYLLIVQDKARRERKKKQLEAESVGVSHSLNFHIRAVRADPAPMSEFETIDETGGRDEKYKREAEEDSDDFHEDEYQEQERRDVLDTFQDEPDPEVVEKFNARLDLMNFFDMSRKVEEDLESQVQISEAEKHLALLNELEQCRIDHNEQVADFMAEYDPKRRVKEEKVPTGSAFSDLKLIQPTDIIAEAEQSVRAQSKKSQAESEAAELAAARDQLPFRGNLPAGLFVNEGLDPTKEKKKRRGPRQKDKAPGVGVDLQMEQATMGDDLQGTALQNLPKYAAQDDAGTQQILQDITAPVDIGFPSLEFYRRKDMDDAQYFMPGYQPKSYAPKQDSGGFWVETRNEVRKAKHTEGSAPSRKSSGGAEKGDGKPRKKKKRKAKKSAASRVADEEAAAAQDEYR